jgi:CxxC motif-containing protein
MNSLIDSDKPMEIICVACPHGCRLEATRKDGEILISNAGCKRGQEYAINEITDPRRMVATTVRIQQGIHPLLPVYTSEPFPKGRVTELLREIRKVEITAPIKMGQVVLENALGTGIDVIASRDLV